MFHIADLTFRVASATIDAFVDDEAGVLSWGVEVLALPGTGDFARWQPGASAEVFASTGPGELKHWLDLAGRDVTWEEPEDEEGEPRALLYVFEHEPIASGHMQFEARSGKLALRWTGRADVNWDRSYGADVPLSIGCGLEFKGVWCGRRPESRARALVSPFLDTSLLEFIRTERGVSLLRPRANPGGVRAPEDPWSRV